MLSRRTTLEIANITCKGFYSTFRRKGMYGTSPNLHYSVSTDKLYDFLFEHNYPAWFCNLSKKTFGTGREFDTATRKLKEFVLRLHTGESVVSVTENWTWPQREKLGQQFLKELAEDYLQKWPTGLDQKGSEQPRVEKLTRSLELDGYSYKQNRLLLPESDAVDREEELRALKELYNSSGLLQSEMVFHHLSLSQEHYMSERWEDSISNSRKFFELILSEIANDFTHKGKEVTIANEALARPARVREFLQKQKILEEKEVAAVEKLYALLSQTGAHPYIAEKDEARLLLHLALNLSQFCLLRYRGFLANQN